MLPVPPSNFKIPLPYFIPRDSEDPVYIAHNRLICDGDINYLINRDLLLKILSDKFKEKWSPRMSEEMARRLYSEAKIALKGHQVLVIPLQLPEFIVPHVEQVYCGSTPLTGRDVTYEWPTGKITRITSHLLGFMAKRGMTIYLRHEEAAMPGKVHHKLLFDVA